MRPIDNQVREYINYCKYNRNMTADTMDSKEWILTTFAKQCGVADMQDFTNRHMQTWVQQLAMRGTVSGRTINTRMAHVIAMAKWLRDMDYDIKLKVAIIDKMEEEPPRRNFFTREQIELAKSHCRNPLELILLSLTFDSGLRLAELTKLRLEYIEGRKIKITGKGRKLRVTYMTQETCELLQRWTVRRNVTDYLWESSQRPGQPYSLSQIRYIMSQPFKRAGIKGFYPHAVRHSFATDMEVNKAPIPVIQKLMGHSNSSITERYLHGLDTNIMEMYDEFKAARPMTNA